MTPDTPAGPAPHPPAYGALARALHWLMALCILAMLFIGVGMVSTVTPKYLTLVGIHKPLGATIVSGTWQVRARAACSIMCRTSPWTGTATCGRVPVAEPRHV